MIEAIESAPLAAIHEPQDEWSTVINAATMLLEVLIIHKHYHVEQKFDKFDKWLAISPY